MSRKSLAPLAALLGLGLLGGSTAAATSGTALVAQRTPETDGPLRLAPAAAAGETKVRTLAGTRVATQIYPARSWRWEGGEKVQLGAAKDGGLEPTDETVLIVFDAGDGVSIEPIVEMFLAMGATVLTFDSPIDPAILTKGEAPDDVLHAMITWASTKASSSGRINLYGVGGGADLALAVAARRTEQLWSVMVDGASTQALSKTASAFAKPAAGFEGVLVVGGGEDSVRALEPAGAMAKVDLSEVNVQRVPDMRELVSRSHYQKTLAMFLNSDFIVPDPGCLVCGLTRTAKRTVLRLEV